MFKKKLISTLWILLGIAAIGLLFVGAKKKGEKLCKGINIEVSENAKQVFVDEQGIKIEVGENGGKVGVPVDSIDLRSIEMQLKKDAWIKDAKLYFDNNQILQVDIKENDPIARIFTLSGNSFFIDSGANYLPTNRNVLARVPVFTGFTSGKRKLSSPDSLLLQQVKRVAQFIMNDSLWMSFASQINVLPDATFQIVPVVGNSIINIGSAENLQDKFNRLFSFYRQVLTRTGINKYKMIDVQYNGQVVGSDGVDSAALKNVMKASDSTRFATNMGSIDSDIVKSPTRAASLNPERSLVKVPVTQIQQKRNKTIYHKTTKKP